MLEDRVSEREKGAKNWHVNGISGRERAREMGTRPLVGEDPKVEFGEEASEVWKHGVPGRREGLDP